MQDNDQLSSKVPDNTGLENEGDNEITSPQIDNERNIGDRDLSIEEEEEPTEEESRSRKIFRMFIRWSVGLLIVFGLGFLTAVFAIYNPKLAQLDESKTELENAESINLELEAQSSLQQGEIETLNLQINTLNQQLAALEDENQKLVENQNNYILQIALLDTRANVIGAQVELYEENSAQARVLLESVHNTLNLIESLLPDDLKDVVAPLKSRLDLVIGGIEDDPSTAIADLSILAGDLLEIENALFNE